MMMMMPRLQKSGSFFLPRKQKSLSLSFSRAQNPQPRVREKNFFIPLYENEEASLWPLSSSSKERVWESTSCSILSFVRIHTLFFSLSVCLEKWSFLSVLFRVLFFHSFFFVERSRFGGGSFSPPASFDWIMNAFFKNERTKKSTPPTTPSSLFAKTVFVGKLSSFDSFSTHPHNNVSLLSILLLSLKTHLRNAKRVFKGGLKRAECTKGLFLSFVLSLGTLYIVKKKEEDL